MEKVGNETDVIVQWAETADRIKDEDFVKRYTI